MNQEERREKLFKAIYPKQFEIKWWERLILDLFIFPTYIDLDGTIYTEYKHWRRKVWYLKVSKN